MFNSSVKSKLQNCAFLWQSGKNIYNENIERIHTKFLNFGLKADGLYHPIGLSEKYLLKRFALLSLSELIRNQVETTHTFQ